MSRPGEPDIEEKILTQLRDMKTGYISGESFSRKFKMTRTGIWKHIHALIEQGYDIESRQHTGYRLVSAPDKLLPAEIKHMLKTKYIGRELYCYNELGSTNTAAMELAGGKTSEGALVIAEVQTEGKGRLGRKWVSVSGVGLWFSVILKPKISPRRATDLTFIAGLAVAKAISAHTGLKAGLKWPNDVYINGKKICGILTEIKSGPDLVQFLVLGIGINVNTAKASFPKEFRDHATSVALELGREVSRLALLKEILLELEIKYEVYKKEGFESFLSDWKKNSITMDKRVKVKGLHENYEGIAEDIDKDGALLLRRDSGELQKIYSGDVV